MPVEIHKIYIANALKTCFGADLAANPDSPSLIRALSEHGHELKLKANSLIPSSLLEQNYLICTSGLMMLEQVCAGLQRHVFAFIFPGTLIGLPQAPDEHYQLKALVESEVIAFKKQDIQQLFQRSPHISRMFLAVSERVIHYFLRHTLMLGKRSAVQRLAYFLLQFRRCSGGEIELYLPMSRKDISSHLGLSEETTSRAFSRLKSDGAIDIKSRYFVKLLDVSLLEALQHESAPH